MLYLRHTPQRDAIPTPHNTVQYTRLTWRITTMPLLNAAELYPHLTLHSSQHMAELYPRSTALDLAMPTHNLTLLYPHHAEL